MIKVGHIQSTFGIKGELKVFSESDFIEQRFKVGNEIILKLRNNELRVKVTSLRLIKGQPVITINDLYDINEVEKYLGYDIYSDIEISLDEGEFYIDDLIDLECFNEEGNLIGKVVDCINLPSSTLLVLDNKKKEFYVPFVDEFIKDVDFDQNKIIIHEIEGLY